MCPPEEPPGDRSEPEHELVHLSREPAGEPEGALILLHGRGTDERDLHPLLDELDPGRKLFGITPGAPLTNLPPGGRHWYVIRQVGRPDEDTFISSLEELAGFLDTRLRDRGIPWERTVIGGFSQGAAVSCGMALSATRPRAAALLMMSGFYPEVPGWELDPGSKRGMPAYVTHGSYDPVIPVAFGRQARDLLTDGGLEVTYREPQIQHSVDPALLPEMREWVAAVVSGQRVAGPPPAAG